MFATQRRRPAFCSMALAPGLCLVMAFGMAAGSALDGMAQVAAQDAGPDARQAAAVYPVRGVVLDGLSHQPIPRALVENNGAAVLTDGDGRFELELPEGMLQIGVRRPGYNARGQDQNHTVNVAASTPELTFYLTAQATITGHVTLSTGEPAEGITLLAYRRAIQEGRERWAVGSSAATDSEGTFRMANLETPGLWVLCSVPMQDGMGNRAAGSREAPATTVGYPSSCYPGPIPASGDSAAANTLSLAAGQQAEFDMVLTRQPFYRVAIAVPNVTGGEGAEVQIRDPSGRALGFSTEWDGSRHVAQVYLPSGQYYAEANPLGTGAIRYGRIDFHVGAAPLPNLSMILFPLHPIPVEIRREFTAASTAQDRLGPDARPAEEGPGINITLVAAESTVMEAVGANLSQRPGSADPSLYELDSVLPGRYWVQTYPYEGYVASITAGGADLSRQPLIVGAGNSTVPIEISLRNNTGKIQCSITGQPAEGQAGASGAVSGAAAGEVSPIFLYAIPSVPTSSQIPQTEGQGLQPMTLANLAPGTYRVVAYDHYRQIDLSNPQQVAEIAARGHTVTVSPGATASVQVEVIHANGSATDNAEAVD